MKKNIKHLIMFLPLIFTEKTTPEEFAKSVDKELDDLKKGLLDKEAFKAELQTLIDTAIKTGTEETGKTVIELKAQLQTAEEAAIKQGEAIEELRKGGGAGQDFDAIAAKNFVDQVKALHGNVETSDNQKAVTVKAAEYPDNAIMVNTHNAIAGAIGSLGTYFAQMIPGIARKPVPKSSILDEVTVIPLNADRLVSISQTETINIAVTLEGAVKPVSNVVWAAFDVAAEAVASIFKTSTKMRRFFKTFVSIFLDTLQDYFSKVIPQLVIAAIRLYAVPFTGVPAQQTHADPNNWDALVAMIASLVKLGYYPNSARMSIFAWEAMMTQKASDGHYMLQNNGSIDLLNKTISFGDDVVVKIHPDVEFGDDEVLVGDLRNIFVGVDPNVDYTEFYDAEDGKRNLLSHRLEKFIAVNIPVANRAGLVLDTFTNVKAAITAPVEP